VGVIGYNAAISACGGRWQLAVGVLASLCDAGSTPDAFSFNALVSSHDRAGLWRGALKVLRAMRGRLLEAETMGFNAALGAGRSSKGWAATLGLLTEPPARFNISVAQVTCAVCLEEILPSERRSQAGPETGCVHTFHWECIRTWFRVKASCPICNTSLLEEGIFEVNPDSGEQTYHRIRPEGVRGSLHAASAAGNAADVQRLIASGANVNRTTLGGVAPLHMAAHSGHAEVIARLLASAADVNQLAPGGTTALYIAAQGQHADAVARLLAGGASVNLPVDGGGTALHVAAQNGHTEAVAWLLAGSAEVDAVMEGGITPLFMAAQSGHIEVIVRLLAQGASVNVTAENGATSLHYASLHGHSESVARLLVARSDVNETTRSGGTALHVAAQSGHTEAVAWLLAGRADVHKEMVGGSTALYLASLGGHSEVIAWLLAKQYSPVRACRVRYRSLRHALRGYEGDGFDARFVHRPGRDHRLDHQLASTGKFNYVVKYHIDIHQQHINIQCISYFDSQQQHINISFEYDIITGQQQLHIKFVDHHVIHNDHHIGLDNNHLIINVTHRIDIRQQHVNIECIRYLDIQQQHICINFAYHIIFVQHHLHINFIDHDVIHSDGHVGHHHNDHFIFKFSYNVKHDIDIHQQHINIQCISYFDSQQQHINISFEYDIITGQQQLHIKFVDHHVIHNDHHIGLDNNHHLIINVTHRIDIRQQHVNIECISYFDIQQQHICINFAYHIIFVQHHLHINFIDHDVFHNGDQVGHRHNDHFIFKFSYNVRVVDDHVNHYDDKCHSYLRRCSRFGSPLESVGGRPGSKPDGGHHAAVSVVGLGLKRRELVASRILRHATKRDPQRRDVDPHQSSTSWAQRTSGRLSPSVCRKVSRGCANSTVHIGGIPGVCSGQHKRFYARGRD
ncbi:ANK3, partial [Symbiodinium microadriaticum]